MKTTGSKIELVCSECGKTFIRKATLQRYSVKKNRCGRPFCSRACHSKNQIKSINGSLSSEYSSGLSMKEIAIRHGVSQETIRKRLIRLGTAIRSRTAHLSTDKNPTRGKGHSTEAIAKIRAANVRQFSNPEARERHAILTCQQIEAGHTGKAYNKLETRVAASFDTQGIRYIQQHRVGCFVFDFYLPDTHTLVEVNGTFWHADPRFYALDKLSYMQRRNLERDQRKTAFALAKGYRLQVIWEADVS